MFWSLKQCRTSWLCFCFVEFVLNPTGKSYVCILHEYAQHTLRVQPRYVFKELGKIKHANSLNLCMYIFCIYTTTIFSSKTAGFSCRSLFLARTYSVHYVHFLLGPSIILYCSSDIKKLFKIYIFFNLIQTFLSNFKTMTFPLIFTIYHIAIT